MNRTGIMLIALLVFSFSLHADNAIKIESISATAGQEDLMVKVLVDNDDALLGISFAGEYDSGLTFKRIELGPDLDGLVEYFEGIDEATYFGAAVITDIDAPYDFDSNVIPAGSDQHCFSLYFDISGTLSTPAELTINLRDGLGDPAISRVFCVAGATVRPDIIDGTVSVVAAPTITGINPNIGPASGNTPVTISGENLTADTDVLFDGTSILNKVFAAGVISGNTPPHAGGQVDVTVTNDHGETTLQDGYWYAPLPTISSVTPNAGLGGETVTVIGTGFTNETDTQVLLDFAAAPFTLVSDTELQVEIPACPAGSNRSHTMQIVTSGGMATLGNAYRCNADPTVTFTRGNANCDGAIDLADAITILSYLFSDGSITCEDACDVNDDGALDLADAISLLSFQFADDDPPDPPFDTPGDDPTADSLGCESECAL